MALIPVDEALHRLLESVQPIRHIETVPLQDANQRILAEDLVARLTQPPFDASAMDGYAVRHRDSEVAGTVLQIIGVSAAGHPFTGKLAKGQAVRIFTGAAVPDGADSIVLQEDCEKLAENHVRLNTAATVGRHIRPRGQDFQEGEVCLSEGTKLDFRHLTLASAMNHANLKVWKQPRIAILSTGDELVMPGQNPGPGQIIGSNSFGIAALARDSGAQVMDLGIVRDDPKAISDAVLNLRDKDIDVLVTLGGASVGDHDIVQPTLLSMGMTLDFWRIAMRPGKPLMVGQLDGMHVLGLPGNPVSSLVCSLIFLEPMLTKLARRPENQRKSTAILQTDLPANDKRQDYIRAQLFQRQDGQMVVAPFTRQDSSMMKIFSQSQCLIQRPPFAPKAAAGESVHILRIDSSI